MKEPITHENNIKNSKTTSSTKPKSNYYGPDYESNSEL